MSKVKFLLLYVSLVFVFATMWNLGEFLIFRDINITPDTLEVILVCVLSCILALIIDTLAYLKKKLV